MSIAASCDSPTFLSQKDKYLFGLTLVHLAMLLGVGGFYFISPLVRVTDVVRSGHLSGRRSPTCLDHAADDAGRAASTHGVASPMQSPPTRVEDTKVISLSPVLTRLGALPRSRCCSTRPSRRAKVFGSISPVSLYDDGDEADLLMLRPKLGLSLSVPQRRAVVSKT